MQAQARIDRYIVPCLVHMRLGRPLQGGQNTQRGALRNRIPGYLWSEMVRPTDLEDVLQYGTLPDLGVYVRERMTSQSVFVPTCQSSSAQPLQGMSSVSSTPRALAAAPASTSMMPGSGSGGRRGHHARAEGGGGGGSGRGASAEPAGVLGRGVLGSVVAFAHACCPSSAPHARQEAQSDLLGHMCMSTDTPVALPTSCMHSGCMHGSIITLLLGSVMPLCKRASQCRRLQATHSQVRSAVSCCTLMEFAVVCSLLQALLLGLYPRGRKAAIFDVRVRIVRR